MNLKAIIRETKEVIGSVISPKSVGPLRDEQFASGGGLRELYFGVTGADMAIADPYKKSVWVYSAINTIAQNLSTAPFIIYEATKSTDVNNPDPVKTRLSNDPLVNLFLDPNPFTNSIMLMQETAIFMLLHGEAFWIIERNNVTEIPKEIVCVNPNKMSPYYEDTAEGKIWTGIWEYDNGREKTLFAPWEVLQFKFPNPYDPIRGMGPLQAASLGVSQDFWSSKYNENYFKNGASIGGFISVKEGLSKEQFERILGQFNDRHQGVNKSHRIALIDGDATFTEAKMSHRDMEFISLKTVTRGEILAAFMVNEVILGNYSNIQSYEGIKNARRAFWEECLIPKIKLIEETLRSNFFSKLLGGKRNLIGEFDLSQVEALREDYQNKVTMAKVLCELGFTPNEVNKKLDMGFAEAPWRDHWWRQLGTIPLDLVDTVGATIELPAVDATRDTAGKGPNDEVDPATSGNAQPGAGTPPPADTPKEDTKPKEDPKKKPKEEKPKPKKSGEDIQNEAYLAQYISKETAVSEALKKKLKRFFFEQRTRVLANIAKSIPEFLDFELEKQKLKDYIRPIIANAAKTGIDLLHSEIEFISDMSQKEIDKYIDEKVTATTTIVLGTVKSHLTYIIKDSADNNYITAELAGKIKEYYNKLNNRINTIARTEICSTINGIRFKILSRIRSPKIFIKWLANTESGRDSHKRFNGVEVELGKSFTNEFTLRYPTDPKAPVDQIINCLCYFVVSRIGL